VLVLSNNDYNQLYQDVIVAAITSNVADREFQVIITNEDMIEGELKVTSVVRAGVYTLSQSIVVKTFGRVQPSVLRDVKKQIDSWSSEKAF
jgi:mRNA interferase MazF